MLSFVNQASKKRAVMNEDPVLLARQIVSAAVTLQIKKGLIINTTTAGDCRNVVSFRHNVV
jgi:hypothetical protein